MIGLGHKPLNRDRMAIGNQHKILIGLSLILAMMLTYRVVNPFRQQTVSRLTYGRTNNIMTPQENRLTRNASDRMTRIKTDLLLPPPMVDLTVYRDPFRRPPKAPAANAPKPDREKPIPPIKTPDERAREALQRFKVFGSFRQGDQEALFLQRGKQVLIINVGDRIDGKFKIEAIDGRSVIVSAAEFENPIQFEFEELQPDDSPNSGRPAVSHAGPAQPQRPASTMPDDDDFEPPPLEPTETAPIDDEGLAPPSLPEPPPMDSPALPFSSPGSPSRDYLPGNKPPE